MFKSTKKYLMFYQGHYHNVACIHLPAGLGHTSANFDIRYLP